MRFILYEAYESKSKVFHEGRKESIETVQKIKIKKVIER